MPDEGDDDPVGEGGSDDANWTEDVSTGGGYPADDGETTSEDVPSADSSAGAGREKGADEKFCTECGSVIKEKAEICPECGVRQPGSGSSGGSDRVAAALLAILLGGLGAHKFYLGQVGMGLLYLCFSWTFIPAIVGLIEGIIYLTKSDEEFRRQYVDG